jgi:hypothetical protein
MIKKNKIEKENPDEMAGEAPTRAVLMRTGCYDRGTGSVITGKWRPHVAEEELNCVMA